MKRTTTYQSRVKSLPQVSFILLLVCGLFAFSVAEKSNDLEQQKIPEKMQGVDIQEHLGEQLPLDLTFKNHKGKEVTLGDYFNQGKPVLINLVYYSCPALCNLVLNDFTKALNQMEWVPGKEFNIVTLSINPEETPKVAGDKRANYLKELRKPIEENGWTFLTGSQEHIKSVTEAIGFKYKKMENGEYAHAAGLFIASEKGVMSRYLYGLDFKGFTMKRGLLDAMEGKQISTMDRILVFCYRYSENTSGYVLFAENFMRNSGYLVLSLVGMLFGGLWLSEWKKKKRVKKKVAV